MSWALAALVALSPAAAAAQASDPLARLPLEAAAVLGAGPDARLLLIETSHGVAAQRLLAIGEEYAEGWILSALSAGSATLTRQGRTRTFALLGRRAASAPAAESAALDAPAVQQVNGVVASPRTSVTLPPLRRTVANSSPATRVTATEAMRAAVAKGDVAAVMAQDGSAVDVLAAWARRNDANGVNMYNAENTDWTSARFVSRSGRLYVAVNVVDSRGRRQASVLEFHAPEFDAVANYRPNWPIEVQLAAGETAPVGVDRGFVVNGAPLTTALRSGGPSIPSTFGFGNPP